MANISGKYISLLGASTSTFQGYSDLKGQRPYYPRPGLLTDVHDTWWMRTINELNLNLCVNNSWSGSCVSTKEDGDEKAGCMDRATQLHNDLTGTEPDIIILIIGGNDALRGYDIGTYNGVDDIYDKVSKTYIGDCTLFGNAYATMVHKVKARYPDADVYVCSMLYWKSGLEPYNQMIKKIADEFRVTYIDFYKGTDISPITKDVYLSSDAIHPNPKGFSQMSDCVVKILKNRYKN